MSLTASQSLSKFRSIESLMLANHLILLQLYIHTYICMYNLHTYLSCTAEINTLEINYTSMTFFKNRIHDQTDAISATPSLSHTALANCTFLGTLCKEKASVPIHLSPCQEKIPAQPLVVSNLLSCPCEASWPVGLIG